MPSQDSAYRRLYARVKQSMSLGDAQRLLEVRPDASKEEILKSYREKALKAHPDRGGDAAKMVELNVAKDTLLQEGTAAPRFRPTPSRGPTPQDYEDFLRKREEEEKRKVKKGKNFATAKASAPTGVDWKFRSTYLSLEPSQYTKDEDKLAYVTGWVCYGQTSNHHVFMLAENTQPNQFADVQLHEWCFEASETYPLTKEIDKLAPKAIKSILQKGKLSSGAQKAPTRYLAMEGLTEQEFRRTPSGAVSLKDILIGTGLVSGAKSDRKVVIELVGVPDRARYKRLREESGTLFVSDAWKYHDFTLYVNGKPYPLSDQTIRNLGSIGAHGGGAFWFAVYSGSAKYDFSKRRVLTKIPGYGSTLIEWIKESLANEPADLTVALSKAIEDLGGKKTAAARVVGRYLEAGLGG